MSKSVTPLESFTHLTEHIPLWLTKLDDLTAQVAEQNARFIRASRFGEHLKKKKHNSTESLRPKDNEDDIQDSAVVPPTDTYMPPNPSYKCLSYASRPKAAANNALVAAELRRKRKPGSGFSNASGHARYRTKSMVIVYYDSTIQEGFEAIVRNIAGARNTLRKGKTTASFQARMATIGMSLDDDPFSGAAKYKLMGPKMMRPPIPSGHIGGPDLLNNDNKSTCFEDADKDLESAQNLCEVAAHQFLRDGDCRLEIEGTRKRFENVLQMAKKEVEQWKDEEEQEKAKEEAETEQKPIEAEITRETPTTAEVVQEKVQSKMEPPPLKQINFTGTGTIEIDDGSDAESVHLDLSAFRRTRRV